MARKLVENDFWAFQAPPPNFLGGCTIFFFENEKIKCVQNCLKWRENWSKIFFGLFSPPQKNVVGVPIFFFKNEKNQSCSKFPEMARKLAKNDFWIFCPPPPQ